MTMADIDALSNRGLVLRFAPVTLRDELQALFTIEQEVLTSLDIRLDHAVAHTRLEWWQQELERLARAEPRHPATRKLAERALAQGRTPPLLAGLIEATRIDLASVAFLDRNELDEYLTHWSQSIFVAATHDASATNLRLGRTIREIELLDVFDRHARRGRIYLPLGDPPAAYQPWLQQPLAATECATLKERLLELYDALHIALQNLPPEYGAGRAIALIWASLAQQQATARARLLPSFAPASRWQAFSRTIRAWRAAVACNPKDSS